MGCFTYKGKRYNSLQEVYADAGVTPEQQQQAMSMFTQYINQGGSEQDIEGFRQFTKQFQKEEIPNVSDEFYNAQELQEDDLADYSVLGEEDIVSLAKDIDSNIDKNQDKIIELLNKRKQDLEEIYTKAKEQWDKLSSQEKRGMKAIENKMLELHKEILSQSDRLGVLTRPISSATFEKIASDILALKGINVAGQSMSNLVDPSFMIEKAQELMQSQDNIGAAALNSSSHILFSQVGVNINMDMGDIIFFDYNIQNGKPSLGSHKTIDGKYFISDLLSEMLGAYTDATNNPFMYHINANKEGIGVWNLMIRLGINPKLTALFMSQSILINFLQEKSVNNSKYHLETGLADRGFITKKLEGLAEAQKEGKISGQEALSEENLIRLLEKKARGEPYSEKDKQDNARILQQFLLLEKYAQRLTDAVLSIQYDTSGIQKNTGITQIRQGMTDFVSQQNWFENYDELFLENQFMYPFRESTSEIIKIITPLFNHLSNPNMKRVFDKFIDMAKRQHDRDLLIDNFKSDFVTYLYHTRLLQGKEHLIMPLQGLKQKKPTIAAYIKRIRDRPEYKDIDILQEMEIHLNKIDNTTGEVLDGITLPVDNLDPDDVNRISESWQRLYDLDPPLAIAIYQASMFQTGIERSPLNLLSFAPAELHAANMKTLQEYLNESDDYSNYIHEFFLNNRQFFKKFSKAAKAENSEWPAWYKVVYQEGNMSTVYYLFDKQVEGSKMKASADYSKKIGLKRYFDQELAPYYTQYKSTLPNTHGSTKIDIAEKIEKYMNC